MATCTDPEAAVLEPWLRWAVRNTIRFALVLVVWVVGASMIALVIWPSAPGQAGQNFLSLVVFGGIFAGGGILGFGLAPYLAAISLLGRRRILGPRALALTTAPLLTWSLVFLVPVFDPRDPGGPAEGRLLFALWVITLTLAFGWVASPRRGSARPVGP